MTPAGVGAHFPSDVANAQDWQVPLHEELQHKPSTQNPLEHSPAQPQACPLDLSPVPLLFAHAESDEASGADTPSVDEVALQPPTAAAITSAANTQILTDLLVVIGAPKQEMTVHA